MSIYTLLTPLRVPKAAGDGEMSFKHSCTDVKDIEMAEPTSAHPTAMVQNKASDIPCRNARLTDA
jgi:hypothetical protein